MNFSLKLTTLLRKAIERIVRYRGYDLQRIGSAPLSFERFLMLCRNAGLEPKTVFDVGVGDGTPWLYQAFVGSKFVLVEPLRRFETDLQRLKVEIGADYHLLALGATPGEFEIRVPATATGASLKDRSDVWSGHVRDPVNEHTETVTVTTLDLLATSYASPYVLKLDVEGFELEALKGAKSALEVTDLIVLEASIIPRHKDDSLFQDIVAYLNGRGFDLIEIVDLSQRYVGGPTAFLDAAFARRGSPIHRGYWQTKKKDLQ